MMKLKNVRDPKTGKKINITVLDDGTEQKTCAVCGKEPPCDHIPATRGYRKNDPVIDYCDQNDPYMVVNYPAHTVIKEIKEDD